MFYIGKIGVSYSLSELHKTFTINCHVGNTKIPIRSGEYDKNGEGGKMTNEEIFNETELIAKSAAKFKYLHLAEKLTTDNIVVILTENGRSLTIPLVNALSGTVDGIPCMESFDQLVERTATSKDMPLGHREFTTKLKPFICPQ